MVGGTSATAEGSEGQVSLFRKDGGPESHVWGLFVPEWKRLFSVVLLRFEDGTRDAYHSHAFNAVSWVLSGRLLERFVSGKTREHTPSWRPILTKREHCHRVTSYGRTWVLSFRGPWASTWQEFLPASEVISTLTHGRRRVT